jgi:hypothetical protein
MNLELFCTLFILQFVGHKVGDYLFQGEKDSIYKSKDFKHLFRHCLMYSIIVTLFVVFFYPRVALLVFSITMLEHLIIDSRTPVVGWKTFFEKKIMRNKNFDINNLPFFVLVEIDQTFHLIRILLLSLFIAHYY